MRDLGSTSRYDPHVNKWTEVAPMAKRRAGVGVVALNGYLYAVGGFDDASPLDTVERCAGILSLSHGVCCCSESHFTAVQKCLRWNGVYDNVIVIASIIIFIFNLRSTCSVIDRLTNWFSVSPYCTN